MFVCIHSYIDSIYTYTFCHEFALSDLLGKPPKKCDLLQLMSRIAFKWCIIGECLGIQYTHLATLQRQTSEDINKLAKVLQLWIDTMPKPVTWNTILQTIESPPIESKLTVMEMEKFLKCECLYNPNKIR